MERAYVVAVGIALSGLLASWLFLTLFATEPGTGSQPYVETLGFAISAPAALVFLTYLSNVFEFETYYAGRSPAAMFGDFLLAFLAAVAAGLFGTLVLVELGAWPLVVFLAGALVTFLVAFVTFLARTREFFEFGSADAAD